MENRAQSLLISNKKEFNNFFKSRSFDIVLLRLVNLHQNTKRYEARNAEHEVHIYRSAKRDANVRANIF